MSRSPQKDGRSSRISLRTEGPSSNTGGPPSCRIDRTLIDRGLSPARAPTQPPGGTSPAGPLRLALVTGGHPSLLADSVVCEHHGVHPAGTPGGSTNDERGHQRIVFINRVSPAH